MSRYSPCTHSTLTVRREDLSMTRRRNESATNLRGDGACSSELSEAIGREPSTPIFASEEEGRSESAGEPPGRMSASDAACGSLEFEASFL
jgi:hypothetical protein